MKKFFRENFKTILGLTLAGFVMGSIWYSPFSHPILTWLRVGTFTALMWIFLWLGNSQTSHWVSRLISWTEAPVKRFLVGMMVMILYTSAVVFFLVQFAIIILGLDISETDMKGTIYSSMLITLVISLFMHGWGFLQNWRVAEVTAEKLQKESIRAQYESLKNQVNPHFLFNSLNALTHLVYEDQDKAAKFIKQLSEVYRYVLDTRDKEIVNLSDELKFLDSYLFLQHIRFGNKLKVTINLNGTKSAVAPLALQMLVENAIKHNVISDEDPLTVEVYPEDDWIVVKNNVLKKTTIETTSGVGLENIRKRYKFLSNREMEVSEKGSEFIVRIPTLDLKE